jgi:hypothetical protein
VTPRFASPDARPSSACQYQSAPWPRWLDLPSRSNSLLRRLHALTTYELTYYRRRLETASLSWTTNTPSRDPGDLQAALAGVITEQQDRAPLTTD